MEVWMHLAGKMLRLLISNKYYRDTDILTAAYHGTTTEIIYQSPTCCQPKFIKRNSNGFQLDV